MVIWRSLGARLKARGTGGGPRRIPSGRTLHRSVTSLVFLSALGSVRGGWSAPAQPEAALSEAAVANPFQELAALEERRLRARAHRPEAVAPLLALFELADVLPARRLDATVQGLIQEGSAATAADPLVAARARDWWARRLEERGDEPGAATVRQ